MSINKIEQINKPADFEMINDIPITLTVELGRVKMTINELLKLNYGSVVELDKVAGEPLSIYANGKLIAKGEVVVINEKYGIRVTDVVKGNVFTK